MSETAPMLITKYGSTQCKWVYKVPLQIVRDFDNAEEYEPSAWFEDYDASR